MGDFMGKLVFSLIAGAFSIYGLHIYLKIDGEIKAKKAEKERLEFSKKRLHNMALRFRDDCMDATNRVIASYTHVIANKGYRQRYEFLPYLHFLSEYGKAIGALKEEYLCKYVTKYAEGDNQLRCEAEDLPDHILEEYKAELSEIASIFDNIRRYMYQHIEELEKQEKRTDQKMREFDAKINNDIDLV